MKKGIHPNYFKNSKIFDNSSNETFTVGSTIESITVEISSLTHPFYTGKQRIVDTDNLVEKFTSRMKKVNTKVIDNKKAKKVLRQKSNVAQTSEVKVPTLKDMLSGLK